MAIRDLIPWGRHQNRAPAGNQPEQKNPLITLHQQVNRLFDDMLNGWGVPAVGGRETWGWPSVEVSETDQELRLTAELPGMTEKDVNISVDDGVLVLSGEKKSESNDKDRGYSERVYGRFERVLPLPSDVDDSKIEARFKDGVLTVTLPRAAEKRGRRIPIQA
jgi:HSP20 family protein